MRQLLAIFKKDVLHLWPEILASLAVMAAMVWLYPSLWTFSSGYAGIAPRAGIGMGFSVGAPARFLTVLVPVTWWVLLARLVHTERLVGDTQFWVTRPYEWPKLLGAKVLFIAAFVCVPFLIARCVLLVEGGFNPLDYATALGWNLLVVLGMLILPVLALSTMTSGMTRLVLVMLGCALYVALATILHGRLPLRWVNAPDGPVGIGLQRLIMLIGLVAVLFVQYGLRRLRLAWMILGGAVLLATVIGAVSPDRWFMEQRYPMEASGPHALHVVYDGNENFWLDAVEGMRRDVLFVSLEVKLEGLQEGMAARAAAFRVVITGANGARWDSSWKNSNNGNMVAGQPSNRLEFQMRKEDYDRLRAVPVSLQLDVALEEGTAEKTLQVALPTDRFVVTDVGRCGGESFYSGDPNAITGMDCLIAAREPQLTYVSVPWVDGSCSVAAADRDTVTGSGWIGSLDPHFADLGISSVWLQLLMVSNGARFSSGKSPLEQRHLCAGSPVEFTTYRKSGEERAQLQLENVQLPEPQKVLMYAGTQER